MGRESAKEVGNKMVDNEQSADVHLYKLREYMPSTTWFTT